MTQKKKSESNELNLNQKPTLRGYFHQEAFFVALGACSLLIAKASTLKNLVAAIIYSFGLLFLFGVSAIYHRPHWELRPRAIMKRIDHSAIFILIAGTFTPFCLISLDVINGNQLLLIIWLTAFLGILQSIFFVKAPKWLTSVLYIISGWLVLPYINPLKEAVGLNGILLIATGGVVYTTGAIFYATKKPNLIPNVFGYHELFHVFTIIGALFHFLAIYQIII